MNLHLATSLMSAAILAAPNAFAAPVFYDNRAAFEAAAGPLSFESFETVPDSIGTVSGFTCQFAGFNFSYPCGGLCSVFPTNVQLPLGATLPPPPGTSLDNAITDGSNAIFYINLAGIETKGRFSFVGSKAFGIDATVDRTDGNFEGKVADSSVTVVSANGASYYRNLTATTIPKSPQFVGVVDPEGINQVVFNFGSSGPPGLVQSTLFAAFDSLSYSGSVSPPASSGPTLSPSGNPSLSPPSPPAVIRNSPVLEITSHSRARHAVEVIAVFRLLMMIQMLQMRLSSCQG